MKHLIPINLLLLTLYLGACFGTYWTINGCDLYPGTQCPGVDLTAKQIKFTDLTGANFTRAKFIRAALHGTIFKKAILDGADFKGANIDAGTNFSGASCKNIKWIDGRIWADGAVPGGPCEGSVCLILFNLEDVSFTTKEVESKYRDLAKVIHPDKSKGNDKKFIELGNCKDVLLLQASDYKSTPPPTQTPPPSANNCPFNATDSCRTIFKEIPVDDIDAILKKFQLLKESCTESAGSTMKQENKLDCCYKAIGDAAEEGKC